MTSEAQKNVMVAAIIIGTIVFIIAAFAVTNAIQQAAVAPQVAATLATVGPTATVSEITATKDSHGFYTLSGSVENHEYNNIKVFGTIDVYSCMRENDGNLQYSSTCNTIKVDSIPFSANPDRKGTATFEMGTKYGGQVTLVGDKVVDVYRYDARIDKVYNI